MKYTIEIKLSGTKSQYYILRAYKETDIIIGGDMPSVVHTSKNLEYLRKLAKERYSK